MSKVSMPAAIILVIVALMIVAYSFKSNFVGSGHAPTGPPNAAAMAEFRKH